MNHTRILCWMAACRCAAAAAGITYDPTMNAVVVEEFPEEDQPATLARVYQADQSNGWNRMAYDPASNTYSLDAHLVIGSTNTEGTYVRIGSAGPLPETLVIRGSVWVRPPQESMKRPDGAFSIMNRLCLGDPTNDAVRGALRFDIAPRHRYGLCVGSDQAGRGALYVFHSSIGALNPGTAWTTLFDKDPADEKAGRYAAGWLASELRLAHATLADGALGIAVPTGRMKVYARRRVGKTPEEIEPNPLHQIEHSTFTRCSGVFAFSDRPLYVNGCAFRNCTSVFRGVTRAVKCVLSDNLSNWSLAGESIHRGMVFVDCEIQPQQEPISLAKNKYPAYYRNPTWAVPEYPQVKYYRSLHIRVVDAAGRPIPDARVTVVNAEFPDTVRRGASVTDADGRTGQDAEKNAIQVLERMFTATEQPEQPEMRTFIYTVKAEQGKRTQSVTLDTAHPIPRPLVIPLDGRAP